MPFKQSNPIEETDQPIDPPLREEKNINNNPDFTFVAGVHDWVQRGPYLICSTACSLEHAAWVGMDYILVGIEPDGKPILKKRL